MAGTLLLLAAAWHIANHEALLLAVAGSAMSTVDDCVVDLIYVGMSLRRRVRRRPATRAADLLPGDGWMAVIVPAWDEATVIEPILGSLTRRLDYPRYRVFVGTYPNDPATLAAIVAVGEARITPVVCADPGPTTKSDCLNHLWRAVVAYEAASAIRFKAVVFHDAEDVVDRDELRVFDAWIPRLAMVQLPVIPLVDPASRWVSGHYRDEFAESHGKDILVRGALGAAVPSAGVACAIDRDVLAAIAGDTGSPFEPACMIEDYELGIQVAALGLPSALIRIPGSTGAVATREHFPATFDSSVRQKTRWLLGIALSGWDRVGWRGGVAHRYMLLRDRKSIFAPLLTAFGYIVAVMVLTDTAIGAAALGGPRLGPLVVARSPLDDPRAGTWRKQRDVLSRRWSGSAYSIVRARGAIDLAAAPALGGGQSGAALAWTLNPLAARPLALTVRATAAQDDRGQSAFAAIGLAWHQVAGVTLAAEQLVAIGPAARDNWTARIAGGLARTRGLLDASAFGEAGVVGSATYAAVQARVGASLRRDGIAFGPGVGAWAASSAAAAPSSTGSTSAPGSAPARGGSACRSIIAPASRATTRGDRDRWRRCPVSSSELLLPTKMEKNVVKTETCATSTARRSKQGQAETPVVGSALSGGRSQSLHAGSLRSDDGCPR